ncbi:hypothetical protein MVEN_00021600 [Mycena venus]|uniref:Uncharacterized protein n=1 Tax=Mycena venus TaxID=2733690 RepID=A0A8H6Z2Z1_9AGAR|nr:hypothetical protein MVEN_00021600 [Mycena venus]
MVSRLRSRSRSPPSSSLVQWLALADLTLRCTIVQAPADVLLLPHARRALYISIFPSSAVQSYFAFIHLFPASSVRDLRLDAIAPCSLLAIACLMGDQSMVVWTDSLRDAGRDELRLHLQSFLVLRLILSSFFIHPAAVSARLHATDYIKVRLPILPPLTRCANKVRAHTPNLKQTHWNRTSGSGSGFAKNGESAEPNPP